MRDSERLPEWLIDDTASIGEARIWITHTVQPRFFGELVCGDEAPIEGVTIGGLPCGQVACAIRWIDPPLFDARELCRSLARAVEAHEAVRQSSSDDQGDLW